MEEIRKNLTLYGRKIVEKGLVSGAGGNISVRSGNYLLLSPSGFFLDEINPEEWVKIDIKSGRVYGQLKPSSEILMHLNIYNNRKDVNAVIHTHPPLTIGLISADVKLRPISPEYVLLFGNKIPIIKYFLPGSEKLSIEVTKQLKEEKNVVLLKNHGTVCIGKTLKEAFARSCLLEETSKSILAGSLLGKVKYLTKQETEEIQISYKQKI